MKMVVAVEDWMLSTVASAIRKSPEMISLVVIVLPIHLVTCIQESQPS